MIVELYNWTGITKVFSWKRDKKKTEGKWGDLEKTQIKRGAIASSLLSLTLN